MLLQKQTTKNSVSQLAKTPCLTLKPKPTNDFEVGRHAKKKSVCTPAHVHEQVHVRGFFDLDCLKTNTSKHFRLSMRAEIDFIQAIPLLFDNLQNTNVVFHDNDFVSEVFETYHSIHAHLFLDWVKTFAIIRSSCRTQLMDGVIQSTDEDFLTALHLFKSQRTKPKYKPQKQGERIWEAIVKYFADKPFGSRDIEEIVLIDCHAINTHLQQFKAKGKLKSVKKVRNSVRYQLVKK